MITKCKIDIMIFMHIANAFERLCYAYTHIQKNHLLLINIL